MNSPVARLAAGIGASALLLGLCSQITGYWYLLDFVGLVPWLVAMNILRKPMSAAGAGLAMAVGFVAVIFPWFAVAISTYWEFSPLTGWAILLVGAPLLQPQFLPFAIARAWTRQRFDLPMSIVIGACVWVGTEWLFPKLLADNLAHGIYPSRILRQFADLGGTAGITFVLVVVNECLAWVVSDCLGKQSMRLSALATAGVLVAGMTAYGFFRLAAIETPSPEPSRSVRIAMVQSNITSYERLRREMGMYEVVRYVLDTHYAMSREGIERHNADALLWSETVYPTTFGHPKSEAGAELDREVEEFVAEAGVPLIFGTYDSDEQGEYNAAVALSGESRGIYRKANLFLFTEYVPWWLDGDWFRSVLPQAGTWHAGDGARVLKIRLRDGFELPFVPMICLDDIVPSLALDGARIGGRLLVGMSNDSWFTESPAGAYLHLVVAAYRSVETRLPQMRVTANGISAVIDRSGEITSSAGMNERRLLIGEAPIAAAPWTLMVLLGDWVGPVAGIFAIAAIAWRARSGVHAG